jgi:bifunctional NMN adenylyltransferase/nudix hydrolase
MASTGVIVGRFQMAEIPAPLLVLIEQVMQRHDQVLIFLGSNPAPSDMNPLDWVLRAQMFQEMFDEDVAILEMPDLSDDRVWSQELDRRILAQRPAGKVTIYGTELGFTLRYSGSYPTEILECDTEEPLLPDPELLESMRDFRAGALYSTMRRFPTVYPTVDIAVLSPDQRRVLLARKEGESRHRFPGGFVDITDDNYEMAAIRELLEECGEDIEVGNLMYAGSCRIDDWRYTGAIDCVMTHLYVCILESGEPQANDDIKELAWFDTARLNPEQFVPEHQDLCRMLQGFLEEMAENEGLG